MEWTFNRILKSNGIKIFEEMAEAEGRGGKDLQMESLK